MKNKLWLGCLIALLSACGNESEEQHSTTSAFLEDYYWKVGDSPYILKPGSTIAVCDTGVKTGVADHVVRAVRIWADAGGRDERLRIVKGCSGDRIIKLVRVSDDVTYFGQAAPLSGRIHTVSVPNKWAGHWTANHEVGHIFGFGHIFERTTSIMNSEDNGTYMNGGKLSSYDYSEIKRMLRRKEFTEVNKLWARQTTVVTHTETVPEEPKSCIGANGTTVYEHGTVTTYRGNTYTCNQGKWTFSPGV
ncbi:hypothetical protein [Oligoflexus tunisiensis]|uniref:hypothetical protein n=1 Tax=Oligoflexus tunisiensis TaxID=708132 RepID=UPI00114CC41D|nr:hypothetical protein [Oligoflexus tunisiensis]